MTCGTVTLRVIRGTVPATFVADDGTQATTTLDEGNALTFDPETISFSAPSTNPTAVAVVINNQEIAVGPGTLVTPGEEDRLLGIPTSLAIALITLLAAVVIAALGYLGARAWRSRLNP